MNWVKRVTYQLSTKITTKTKQGVMILDEADTIIFPEVGDFFKETKYKNLMVIGLTATPFHGKTTGIEGGALAGMGY